MGNADRRMRRALAVLDDAYAKALLPHRNGLGGATDDDLAAWHTAAVRAARTAADREGGPGWLARSGHSEAWVDEHLWNGHVAPFAARGWPGAR